MKNRSCPKCSSVKYIIIILSYFTTFAYTQIYFSPGLQYDLEHIPNIEGGNLIYSMWRGYEKKKSTKEFIDYLKSRNFTVNHIHSSGHADFPTLEKMVNAISPKTLVPIHTFNSQDYKNIF